MLDLLRRGLQLTPINDTVRRRKIKELRVAAYDILADVPLLRGRDRQFWREQGNKLGELLTPNAGPDLQAEIARSWVSDALKRWENRELTLQTSQRAVEYGPTNAGRSGEVLIREALGWLGFAMAGLVARSAEVLTEVAEAAVNRRRRGEKEAGRDLLALVEFLAPEGGRSREEVVVRLLTLDVVLYAVASEADVRDQFVELVQISANVPTAFEGPARARDKLAGAQLGNFAAFYRKAWRANDWMFGRLDGAERLVRVILNPARFLRLYSGRGMTKAVVDALGEIAVPQPGDADENARQLLEGLWRERRDEIEKELAFLDNPDYPVPEQLSHAADAIVHRIQLGILRDELHIIAGAVEDDITVGADETGPAARFRNEALRRVGENGLGSLESAAPEILVGLFRQCHIGEERFEDEVGSDLFTRTVTRVLAVATTALSGEQSGLGPVRRVLQTLRLPTLIVDAVAQTLVRQSRTAVAVFVTALVGGGVIVALEFFTAATPPALLLTVGATAFVGAVAVFLRKSPKLLVSWLLLAIAVWLIHHYLPGAIAAAKHWIGTP